MGDIGQSLTRKLGPLPVWVWALVAGLALYVFRSKGSANAQGGGPPSAAATAAEAQLVQAEAQARASTLQQPVSVSPGEQIYDPNTGFTTPVNTDWPGILGALGNSSNSSGTTPATTSPTTSPTPKPMPKLRGKGAIRAPSGHNKPTAPKNYHDVGLGGGAWEFLPNKVRPKSKKKPTHKPPTSTKPGHQHAAAKKKGKK